MMQHSISVRKLAGNGTERPFRKSGFCFHRTTTTTPNQEFTMEARIIRECDMFGRVITFWKTNSADIPAGSKGATYSANLGIDRQKLVDAGATQKGGKVTAQNALLLTLDTDLQAIARTAHAIAQDVPGFDDLFAPPEHYNPGEVLATANAYLAQLAVTPSDDVATKAAKAARVTQFTDHA